MVINLQREGKRVDRDRRLGRQRRIFFNGRDVSFECDYVDGRRKVVRLYVRGEDGLFRFDPVTREPFRIQVKGRVAIRRRRQEKGQR